MGGNEVLKMRTWADVVMQIRKHSLPLKVERFNMSSRRLVRLNGDPLAYTVKLAVTVVKAVRKSLDKAEGK